MKACQKQLPTCWATVAFTNVPVGANEIVPQLAATGLAVGEDPVTAEVAVVCVVGPVPEDAPQATMNALISSSKSTTFTDRSVTDFFICVSFSWQKYNYYSTTRYFINKTFTQPKEFHRGNIILDEHEQLQQASAQLYAIFARYPARPGMWACSCCVSHEAIVALTTVPLRSLCNDDLERYSFKALTTWGKSEDYRYFLPRLLELCALNPGSYSVNIETICRKLEYAQWENWPQDERQAISDYLLAFWQLILTHEYYAFDCSAGEYLEALSQALEDLTPFLQAWRQSEKATALHALADFVNKNGYELGSNHMLKWPVGYPPAQQQIITWLLEPATRQSLEDSFFCSEDQEFSEELARAADILFFLNEAGW